MLSACWRAGTALRLTEVVEAGLEALDVVVGAIDSRESGDRAVQLRARDRRIDQLRPLLLEPAGDGGHLGRRPLLLHERSAGATALLLEDAATHQTFERGARGGAADPEGTGEIPLGRQARAGQEFADRHGGDQPVRRAVDEGVVGLGHRLSVFHLA
ncbi:hypothetical protein QFZ21_003036 [Microbacterium sp. W4I20]|nr:hypothetical protein [Microbacterium sp. W4I20]MDQ0728036.1 hypothetical protein [Microbacterium sp. W4I20]